MGSKVSISKLCRGCMNSIEDTTGVCPICGFNVEMYNVKKNELRLNFILTSRYMIGKVVAESDNEITYIGWDLVVDCRVLVKEYYPKGLVTRNKVDEGRVNLVDNSTEGIFCDRKKSYKKVSNDMVNLRKNSGMVKVVDVFEDNNTIYQVILCPQGHTVSDVLLKYDGMIPANHVGKIITSVADNLSIMHKSGLLCDAINVNNILITDKYEIEMLDYNTASNFLKYNNAGVKSDIYDVCAIAYIMLVDRLLTKAEKVALRERIARVNDVRRPSELGVNISSDFEEVIIKGLGFEYNSSKELYKDLSSIKKFEDKNNPNIAQMNDFKTVNENNMCNVQEGRQDMMREDRNERGINNSAYLYNQSQGGYRSNGMNVGSANGTARLNSALRSGRYNNSNVGGGYKNVDNVTTVYDDADESRYNDNVVSLNNESMVNASRNYTSYPIQDEWNDRNMGRVRGSYNGVDNTSSITYQNSNQAKKVSNRPKRPAVSAENYPMSYNNGNRVQLNNSAALNHVGTTSFLNSDNEELRNRGNKTNYDVMPMNFDEEEKKSGKKTFFSVVACSLLVGLAVFMVVKTYMAPKEEQAKASNNKYDNQSATSAPRQDNSKAKLEDGTEYNIIQVSLKSNILKTILEERFKSAGKNVDMTKLTTKDLSEIKELSLDGQSIDTLEDLSYFPALEKVSLNGCELTDNIVASIKGIPRLKEIDLSNNPDLTTIDSLKNCEKLEKVNLGNTGVTKDVADRINANRSSTVSFAFAE